MTTATLNMKKDNSGTYRKEIYTIRVLDDAEFDKLPYEGIGDSLGFADPEIGDAFVRKTGIKEMDMATIQHEMQELISTNSFHEDANGIRHKKWKDFFTKIVAPIGFGLLTGGLGLPAAIGAIGSGVGGAVHGYQEGKGKGALLGGVTGALGGYGGSGMATGAKAGIAASKAAGGGGIGQTFSGIQGALGITPGAAGKIPAGTAYQGGAGGGAASATSGDFALGSGKLISPAAVDGGIGGSLGSMLGSQAASNVASGAGGVGGAWGAGGVVTEAPKQGILGQIGGKLSEIAGKPETILGAGSLLASSVPNTPQFQFPSTVDDLRKKLMEGEGLSSLGQQARTELSGILSSEPQDLYPTSSDAYMEATLRRTRESYAEAEKQLDSAYNLAGTYGSGEHMAQKAKLKEELARTESAVSANEEQRRFEMATTQKYNAIAQALGVDQNVMNDLVGLTGLDVQTAAMMYGAQVEDINAIREALGSVGSELLTRGVTGYDPNQNTLGSLIGGQNNG